jgi:hypothetical protein
MHDKYFDHNVQVFDLDIDQIIISSSNDFEGGMHNH